MATKKRLQGNNGLDANNLTISNVATPTASSDASTKGYADTLVPSQAGNTGKYLTTNGSATSWATVTASASAEALTGTTIASNVTGSSLTSVGTLGSLTVSGNATFDTNTLFVDATNDRVGVGTVSPSAKLDVNGGDLLVDASSVGDERGIFFRRGFTSTDKYNVSILVKDHDGNFPDGLSINAYDGISFCTGSNTRNERMRLNVNGNLGLSTTNPVYKMQIEPTSVTAGGVNNLLRIGTQSTTTGTTSRFSMFCSTDPVNDTNGGKVFIDAIRTATNMDFAISLNDTAGAPPVERLRLLGNGNLGLGTSSPVSKLTVNGHANIIGGNSLYFNLDSGSTAHGQIFDDGNFHIHSINSSAMWINSPNGTGVYVNNQATGNVYLANQGSVSIGGTDIYEKLNVRGQARLHTSNPYLLFRNEAYPTIWGSRIRVTDYGDGMGINFETSDNTDTWGTRMVVRHNGNVGISTTAPAYKLDVNGSGNFNGVLNIAYGTGTSGADHGLSIYHGSNSGGYGRIRFYENNSNTSTIHNFSTTWQGGSSGTINTNSAGCINLDGPYGVTIGGWNGPTASFNRTTGLSTFNGAVSVSGAITQSGNQVLHAGNYSSYAIPNSGSWLGDLGSYGFTRYAGMSMSGGSEVVFLYKGGQGYTLIDGNYMAFEGGGFYSSYNSSGGTLLGMKAIATNTLELTARTSIRRSAYTVGASDFFMELTAPDDGSGNGEIGLRFHLEGRYWRQIRANSGGFKFTQGSNNDTVNVTAYDVIAQNDVSASRYVNSVYFNQSSGNSENPTIGQIWTQNTTDNYCRKSTPAHFKNQMGMYVNGGSSTSNNITISSSSATGGSNGDIWLKY